MTEIMTGSVTLGILAEDWQRHHQPLELLMIARGVWKLYAPWGWLDDDVVIDAPAEYHQRNQDQDDV